MFLAVLMCLSSFAGILPANVFASELPEEEIPAETTATSRQSYEIPLDEVTFSDDGGLIITLPEPAATEAATEESRPAETEPAAVTEPMATEPVATESAETVPAQTSPTETAPAETVPAETIPLETAPAETVPTETVPAETLPAETIPVETVPMETVPMETEPVETEPVAVTEPMTWFQWLDDQGLDNSSLTKEQRAALRREYAAYRLGVLAEANLLPDGATPGNVSNDYLDIHLMDNGHFTIGNRIGNPDYYSDDNQRLLYGYPDYSTSETLIYIDDGDYENYFYADTISYSYNTATATMLIPSMNIKVVQTLKLIKVGSNSFEDTVQIQYQVYNTGSKSHDVGIRIMLDTMLANNDWATFRVSSQGNITESKVYTGSAIPSVYQVYDDLDDPTTLATGYLYRSNDIKPDKVQFCNWPGISGSGWSHSVGNGDTLGDSAVGIYFNPRTVKAGKNFSVRTYYGVSVSTGDNSASEILSDHVKITVKDSVSKAPLSDVEVSCIADLQSWDSGVTGSDGSVLLKGWNPRDFSSSPAPMTIRLVLKKDGYKASTVNCAMYNGTQYVYTLAKDNTKTPVVSSVVLKTSGGNTDLLSKTCKYVEDGADEIAKKGATGTVTIKATADMAGCTWMLIQDEKVLQRNSTGEFTLNIRETDSGTLIQDLVAGANLYIKAVSSDGKDSAKMRLGLKVSSKTTPVEFFPLDMGEIFPSGSSKLAEGTLAALFLGNKFTFGLNKSKSLNFQVELVDGGKVRVGLNFDIKEWNNMNKKLDNGQTKQQLIDSLAKEMKDYASKKNTNMANKIAGGVTKFNYGSAKANLAICGYGEGMLENGKVRIDLTVFLALQGQASHTTQFLLGTIPCYIQVGGKAEAKLQASANLLNSEGVQFQFYDAEFTPSMGVWLEGGAGIKGAVSIGAKGEGNVSLTCNLVTNHQVAKLVASASVVAEVAFWEKEFPFLEKTIVLYDSNDKDGTVYGGDENIYEMLESVPFRLVTREEMSGVSADGGTSTNGTQVRMLNVGGTQYKFFLADRGGNQSNRFMLAYSVLTDGGWSEPVAVADDGTTDIYYDVATDGTDIYVVWSNSSKLFSDDVTIDEMFFAQEICFTTISGSVAAEPLTLTSNSAMDIMPAVTTAGGSAYVAWYHTANGFESNTDVYNHYLHYTSITDGVAGTTGSIDCGAGAISSVSAATVGQMPKATYVTNASDEYTFEDSVTHEVNLSSGDSQSVDTTDKTVGKAVSATLDGETLTFWMENGNIAYAESMNAEQPSYVFAEDAIPGGIGMQNYTVITVGGNTYLIWVESGEETGNVAMTSIYTNGAWTNAHKLTSLSSGNISGLDGYENSEGQLVLVYTAKNLNTNYEGGVDVSTAALEKVVEPEKTVSLNSVDFEVSNAIPGGELPITLTVTNTGNTTIDALSVAIDSQAGENFCSRFTGLNIKPGTTEEVEVTGFALSNDLTTRTISEGEYTYYVTVYADTVDVAATETFEIGYDHIRVYKQELALLDGRENLVIAVENVSGFPASDVHVQILADSEDGVLVYDNVFGTINGNDWVTIYLDVEDLNSTRLYASAVSAGQDGAPVEYMEMTLSGTGTTAVLTPEVYGCGSISPDTAKAYTIGEEVFLVASPDEGYVFDGWYTSRDVVWVDCTENDAWVTLEMPAGDTSITARFVSQEAYDFTLSTESADLTAGDTLQLSAIFASEAESSHVDWSSSDESVVCVDHRGLVTALGAGTATVTATCGEYTHTCLITVSYVDITSVQMVYPTVDMGIYRVFQQEVVTDPENCEASLRWTSSDESVATVDRNGEIISLGYGSAVITATAYNDETVTASCVVNVLNPVADIMLDQYELNLTLTDNQAELNVLYDPVDATFGKTIIWSVDDPSVLELTPSGDFNEHLRITARNFGSATITARSEEGHEVSCSVIVQDIVYVDTPEELQSAHPYEAGLDRTWVYTDESKEFLLLTFDEETCLSDYDRLYVMDGNGDLVEEGTSYDFSGRTILVNDSTVRIRLVSGNNAYGNYGFRVAEISDVVSPEHISIEAYDIECTGAYRKPNFPVYFQGRELIRDVDYTLSFTNTRKAGEHTVTFKGLGIFEGVTKSATFQVLPSSVKVTPSITSKGIKLSWTASKGATGYYLYRSVNGSGFEKIKTLSSSTKSYTDTKTSADKSYNYHVIPFAKVTKNKVSTIFEGYLTSIGPITKLSPVSKLKVTTNQTGGCTAFYLATLKWNAVKGADGYIIQTSTDGKFFRDYSSTYRQDATTYSISIDDDGLRWYRVIPYKYIDGTQCEGIPSSVVTTCGLYAPTLDVFNGDKGICLEYGQNYLDVTSSIEIYRRAGSGKWTKVKTFKNTDSFYGTLTDKDAKKSGTVYTYRARTVVTRGDKKFYGPYSQEVSITRLSRPVISSIKQTDGGMQLSWKKIPGADYYVIYRDFYPADGGGYISDEFTYTAANAKETTHRFTDPASTAAGEYSYSIGAFSNSGSSSEQCDWMYAYVLRAPAQPSLENAVKGVQVSCSSNNWYGNVKYELWRSAAGGEWTKVKGPGYATTTDTGATRNNQLYTYKVRSYIKNSVGTFYSPFSEESSIYKMGVPKVTKGKILSDGNYRFTFSAVSDAQYYDVWRNISTLNGDNTSEFVTRIESAGSKTKSYSFTDTGAAALAPNTSCEYKIIAVRVKDDIMSTSTGYADTFKADKATFAAKNESNGIRLYIPDDYETNFISYEGVTIYRSVNGGSWKKLKTIRLTNYPYSYLDKDVKAGKTYSYKVLPYRDYYTIYDAEQSDVVSTRYYPGPKLNAPVNKAEGVALSWSKPAGKPAIGGYRVYRWNHYYERFELLCELDADVTSFVDTAAYQLEDFSFVAYQIAAVPTDESLPLLYSNVRETPVMMPPPSNLSGYASDDGTMVDLFWDNPSSYHLKAEIRYVSGKTTKTIRVNTWGDYQIKGLKPTQDYTFTVRHYVVDGKTTYYSDWSNPFTIYR